jgi:CarboxypepD_reg-like domain/Gram-negative bacterial TonB protein C-terminal
MKEKNKIYTAADFARYHAGTMPVDEMHALEKAALEDPFLGDALEGYVHAPAVKTDIAELQARLAEKQKKKDVFLISSFAQNKWWRIAALFIVIAGAGYLFYRVNYVNKENSLAKNGIKTSTEKKDNVEPVKTDSATTKNDIAFENQQASKFAQTGKASLPAAKPQIKKEIVVPEKAESMSGLISADKSKDGFYYDSINFIKSNKENEAQVATEYSLKGKVTDEKGNAVPYASITDEARNKVTVTDTAGRFLLRSQDSSITAMASATGYASKSFTLKKDAQPTIAMSKADAELSDVVVTGMSKYKRVKESASASKSLNGKVADVQMTSALPQPSGGQEKFDQYLKENRTPIYNENGERLTGEVLLSFTINKKGRPKNIKVVKSSCVACEKEAIKLLENGPDWTGRKDKQGTAVIKF